jgi:hypothetical protein
MKAYVGVDVEIHIFLISALVGVKWFASRPDLFTPRERTPGTHWIVGWVGPRNGLDNVENRKFLIFLLVSSNVTNSHLTTAVKQLTYAQAVS